MNQISKILFVICIFIKFTLIKFTDYKKTYMYWREVTQAFSLVNMEYNLVLYISLKFPFLCSKLGYSKVYL